MECKIEQEKDLPDIRRCPKKMLNGPCGGQVEGRCEVNPKIECVWVRVYRELKKKGREGLLKELCMR